MLSLHDELSHSVYGFSECEETLTQGHANIVWEMKTGKKHYLNDTSLIAVWQVRIEFSPLIEASFNQEQNLSENLVSAIDVTESWGGTHLGRNPSGYGLFCRRCKRQEVHGSLSFKGGRHFSVFFFSRSFRLSLVKMQRFSFLSFVLVSFALFLPAKIMIQQQLSP